MAWTKGRLEKIRKMVADGYSTSTIGKTLGVTRNAIIGICHRRGIQLKSKPLVRNGSAPKLPQQPFQQPHLKPKHTLFSPSASPSLPPAPPPPPDHKGVSLLELGEHHCRWPMENGAYCGNDRDLKTRQPYCRYHGNINRGKG